VHANNRLSPARLSLHGATARRNQKNVSRHSPRVIAHTLT